MLFRTLGFQKIKPVIVSLARCGPFRVEADPKRQLEKLVDVAADRDLASGIVRRSDQDVVASISYGGRGRQCN